MLSLRLTALTAIVVLAVAPGCGGDDVPSFPQRRDREPFRQCTEETPVPGRDAGRVGRDSGAMSDAGAGADSGTGADSGIDAAASGMGGGMDADGGAEDAGAAMDAGGGGGRDAGRPSGGGMGCGTGEVCLRGRCYPACTSDSTCLAEEMCTGGVCIPRTMPRADGGPPPDTGGTDVCSTAMCMAPTPLCHPSSNDMTGAVCVECTPSDLGTCGGPFPICETASGRCVPFVAAANCSPCNNDRDCVGLSDVGGDGRCTTIDPPLLPGAAERVCLVPCPDGVTCPVGMACSPTGVCLPRLGTCTNWRRAYEGRACTTDAECVPVGVVAYPGTCLTTCRHPCGPVEDCRAGLTACGADGFCI